MGKHRQLEPYPLHPDDPGIRGDHGEEERTRYGSDEMLELLRRFYPRGYQDVRLKTIIPPVGLLILVLLGAGVYSGYLPNPVE